MRHSKFTISYCVCAVVCMCDVRCSVQVSSHHLLISPVCPVKVPTREPVVIDGVPHSKLFAEMDDSCAASRCKVTGAGMKACSQCKMVTYCSVKCQKMDWKASHKKACYSRSYSRPAPSPAPPGPAADEISSDGDNHDRGSKAEGSCASPQKSEAASLAETVTEITAKP